MRTLSFEVYFENNLLSQCPKPSLSPLMLYKKKKTPPEHSRYERRLPESTAFISCLFDGLHICSNDQEVDLVSAGNRLGGSSVSSPTFNTTTGWNGE